MSEEYDLLLKVHVILDMAVSKRVGNSAFILAHVFNTVSRQHCEVWASEFPFLHSLREVILLVRPVCMAILTGLWCRFSNSLPQVCLSPFPLRGVARPGHGLEFHFMVQKRSVPGSMPGSSGQPLAIKNQ